MIGPTPINCFNVSSGSDRRSDEQFKVSLPQVRPAPRGGAQRPTCEIFLPDEAAVSSVPLAQAAKQLHCHRSTISRWLKQGAPCLEEGRDGRGHSAIVNVDALMRWKAGKLAPALAQRNDDDILRLVETALFDALKRDDLARRTKTTDAQAALAVLIIFERLYRNVKQQPLEPRGVPEQMRRLCTDYLDSVERGTFQRR